LGRNSWATLAPLKVKGKLHRRCAPFLLGMDVHDVSGLPQLILDLEQGAPVPGSARAGDERQFAGFVGIANLNLLGGDGAVLGNASVSRRRMASSRKDPSYQGRNFRTLAWVSSSRCTWSFMAFQRWPQYMSLTCCTKKASTTAAATAPALAPTVTSLGDEYLELNRCQALTLAAETPAWS